MENTIKSNPKKDLMNVMKIKLRPLKIKWDIRTLDMIMSFIYKDSVLKTRKVLSNIDKMINNLDDSLYKDNNDLQKRIWIIRKSLYVILHEGFEDPEALKEALCFDTECDDYTKKIIDDINVSKKPINHEESKALIKRIDDALEFGYSLEIKQLAQEIFNKIDDDDFKSYKSIQEDLIDISTAVVNIKRNNSSLRSGQTFSLDPDVFENVVDESVQKLKDRNRIFVTGIKRLNTFLAPGYMSKRLYTYLAFPGKGKSTILLKSAIDIRRYNNDIKTKDPDKRPAVLMLTLENDIAETVERIYNMTVDSDDIRNYTPKQVKKKLKTEGKLSLTDDNNINIIIQEYKNREISTDDIYGIVNDLNDDGEEVIAIILDYIKRIRPAEKAETEKEELKNISNELKEIAKFYDCPVITAQQLNRSGASVVDAAIQANKEDVTRLVGRDSIAGSWEILENSDWTCIINPEKMMGTDDIYMTFKLLKRRYRSMEENEHLRTLEYFNQPFDHGSNIKILDDIELDDCLALESLATSFTPVEERGPSNATKRPKENSEMSSLSEYSENDNESLKDLTPKQKNKKKSQDKLKEIDDFEETFIDIDDMLY